MGRDGDLAHGNVAEKGGFTDTLINGSEVVKEFCRD